MPLKSRKAKEKEEKEKSHTIKNTFFMLGIIWKATPEKVLMQFLATFTTDVYYRVIFMVYFLKTAVDIIETGGAYKEFLLKMVALVLVKVLIDTYYYWYFQKRNDLQNVKVYRAINLRVYAKASAMELSCFENPDFFNRYKRAREVTETNLFRDFMGNLCWFCTVIITSGMVLSYIVSIDPVCSAVLLCSLFAYILRNIRNKLRFKKDKEMTPCKRSKEYVRRTVFLKDYAKEIKTSGVFGVLQKRFELAVEETIRIIKKYGWKTALLDNGIELISGIIPMIGAYSYCCWRFLYKGDLAVADFAVLATAVLNLKNAVQWVLRTMNDLHENCLYIQNLREFLTYEPKLVGGDVQPEAFESIEFRNVSFRYDGKEEDVLHDVSFTIRKGERIAIVGANGAGKTTLSKLLMRLYDVTAGQILVNGIDIRTYDLTAYRERFGSVFQDFKLLSLTVAENVLMRACETPADRALVTDCLRKSGVYDKIESLPNGIDTLLTKEFDDEGTILSGGESQKVAIARLFAKPFDTAILDEPSSALDPIAEYKMYESLMEATRGRTVVYISHRLSSAVLADRVLVFADGCLRESGTHRTLLADKGLYAEMFTVQAQNYTLEEAKQHA